MHRIPALVTLLYDERAVGVERREPPRWSIWLDRWYRRWRWRGAMLAPLRRNAGE